MQCDKRLKSHPTRFSLWLTCPWPQPAVCVPVSSRRQCCIRVSISNYLPLSLSFFLFFLCLLCSFPPICAIALHCFYSSPVIFVTEIGYLSPSPLRMTLTSPFLSEHSFSSPSPFGRPGGHLMYISRATLTLQFQPSDLDVLCSMCSLVSVCQCPNIPGKRILESVKVEVLQNETTPIVSKVENFRKIPAAGQF